MCGKLNVSGGEKCYNWVRQRKYYAFLTQGETCYTRYEKQRNKIYTKDLFLHWMNHLENF